MIPKGHLINCVAQLKFLRSLTVTVCSVGPGILNTTTIELARLGKTKPVFTAIANCNRALEPPGGCPQAMWRFNLLNITNALD